MPRKTKDITEEVKNEAIKTTKKSKLSKKETLDKPTVKKSSSTSKKSSIKKDDNKKASSKSVAKKVSSKSTTTKKSAAKTTTNRNTTKTTSKETKNKAKTSSKKELTKSKKTSTKKSTVKTTNKKTTTRTSIKKTTKTKKVEILEYYDLPYRYNETIVKILAQTPTTLFVYWDISDEDKSKFIKQYGEYFFDNTKPVLLIQNITKNYSFEIDINDFANSWYLQVEDSDCDYKIELGRRPIIITFLFLIITCMYLLQII